MISYLNVPNAFSQWPKFWQGEVEQWSTGEGGREQPTVIPIMNGLMSDCEAWIFFIYLLQKSIMLLLNLIGFRFSSIRETYWNKLILLCTCGVLRLKRCRDLAGDTVEANVLQDLHWLANELSVKNRMWMAEIICVLPLCSQRIPSSIRLTKLLMEIEDSR